MNDIRDRVVMTFITLNGTCGVIFSHPIEKAVLLSAAQNKEQDCPDDKYDHKTSNIKACGEDIAYDLAAGHYY
jgi:hypothetical protein